MLCTSCNKILSCSAIRSIASLSDDFSINICKNYSEVPENKYKHIAEHDYLMAAIYDYFTGNLPDYIDDKTAKERITEALFAL